MTAARQPERRHPRGVGRAWADLPLRSKGLVVVAIPLLALLLATVLFGVAMAQDRRAQAAVLHTMEVEREIAQVRILVAPQLGLDLAGEHDPDLVLLDLHLPDIPGETVLHRLQANPKTAGIPVVILNADARPGLIQRLLEQGARAFLTKPLDVKELLELLDAVAAERQEAIAAG